MVEIYRAAALAPVRDSATLSRDLVKREARLSVQHDAEVRQLVGERYATAKADGLIVGVSRWQLIGGVALILSLVVEPSSRGLGVGSSLLSYVEHQARTAGAERVEIVANESGMVAEFLLGRGFEPGAIGVGSAADTLFVRML